MVQVRPGRERERERALVRIVLDAGVLVLRIARPGTPCFLPQPPPLCLHTLYFLMDHIL